MAGVKKVFQLTSSELGWLCDKTELWPELQTLYKQANMNLNKIQCTIVLKTFVSATHVPPILRTLFHGFLVDHSIPYFPNLWPPTASFRLLLIYLVTSCHHQCPLTSQELSQQGILQISPDFDSFLKKLLRISRTSDAVLPVMTRLAATSYLKTVWMQALC